MDMVIMGVQVKMDAQLISSLSPSVIWARGTHAEGKGPFLPATWPRSPDPPSGGRTHGP